MYLTTLYYHQAEGKKEYMKHKFSPADHAIVMEVTLFSQVSDRSAPKLTWVFS